MRTKPMTETEKLAYAQKAQDIYDKETGRQPRRTRLDESTRGLKPTPRRC